MNSPFPGMDPYLEHPALWPDLHNSLIAAIRDELAPRVAPRYFVATERRAYRMASGDLAELGIADVAVGTTDRPGPRRPAPEPAGDVAVLEVEVPAVESGRQAYLELRDVERGTLVTIVELLSPANKLHRRGRLKYEAKRRRVFDSATNLVEIDLLRAGRPMPLVRPAPASDYRILISRGDLRPQARLYAFSVRHAIPTIPVPLLPGDDEPELPLNAVLHGLYERARYDLRLNYAKPPVPPLAEADASWARERIAAAR